MTIERNQRIERIERNQRSVRVRTRTSRLPATRFARGSCGAVATAVLAVGCGAGADVADGEVPLAPRASSAEASEPSVPSSTDSTLADDGESQVETEEAEEFCGALDELVEVIGASKGEDGAEAQRMFFDAVEELDRVAPDEVSVWSGALREMAEGWAQAGASTESDVDDLDDVEAATDSAEEYVVMNCPEFVARFPGES